MGPSNRVRSAHMEDTKGKGIIYEDDDEPIMLEEQDDSHTIRKFRMSLIGKVLNPKNQNVEKLLQFMPTQWKMEDCITANYLGNGKFLFNFSSEDDIQEVLRQGPFTITFVCLAWCDGNPLCMMTILGSSHFGWRSPAYLFIYGL
ncbi:uncharacterized protein LOC125594013 [Brassica napus]|uniref:uncharacterized protein LOC125584323 n=1 Tax=Brassica napus TaxID=3708 RepID=UPI0004F1A3D6|nr:uncharacterized protein LOC125584323 [Brassica napus]XP_048626292.1 uncharacterized protein LOC125594013 [Brassica napus]